jgi:hypothetical protein
MDRSSRIAVELNVLRALCDGRIAADLRFGLCGAMAKYIFEEPEHQIVFESVQSLLGRDQLSADQLGVTLIKRGFPDMDMGRYFVDEHPGPEQAESSIGELTGPRAI